MSTRRTGLGRPPPPSWSVRGSGTPPRLRTRTCGPRPADTPAPRRQPLWVDGAASCVPAACPLARLPACPLARLPPQAGSLLSSWRWNPMTGTYGRMLAGRTGLGQWLAARVGTACVAGEGQRARVAGSMQHNVLAVARRRVERSNRSYLSFGHLSSALSDAHQLQVEHCLAAVSSPPHLAVPVT